MDFAKFLRAPFLHNTSRRLLLLAESNILRYQTIARSGVFLLVVALVRIATDTKLLGFLINTATLNYI